jgi:hypothetical protein
MNNLLKGLTYSYGRNIGWQDRAIRSAIGIAAVVGTVYYYLNGDTLLAGMLCILFIAQLATVLTAKCMICFYTGTCTITPTEKRSMDKRGVPYEH